MALLPRPRRPAPSDGFITNAPSPGLRPRGPVDITGPPLESAQAQAVKPRQPDRPPSGSTPAGPLGPFPSPGRAETGQATLPLTPQQGEARGRALSTLASARSPSTFGFGAANAPTPGSPQEAQANAQRNERLRAEAEASRGHAEAAAIAERERRAGSQFEEERRQARLREQLAEQERRRLEDLRRRGFLTEDAYREAVGGTPATRRTANTVNPYTSLPDDEGQRPLGAANAGTFQPAEGVLEQRQERELRGFRARSDIEREAAESLTRQEGERRRSELELGGRQALDVLERTGTQRRGELELGGQQALEQLSRRGQLDIEGLRERGRMESEAEERQFGRIRPLLGPLIGLPGRGGGDQPITNVSGPSPEERRSTLARGAAFGRAKEQTGDITQGALRALESQLAGQGFTEAPMGAGEAAARAQVISGGARGLTDVSRAQAIGEERRAQEVEDQEAAAALERRGQDITEMGQRRAIAPALLALMGRRLF